MDVFHKRHDFNEAFLALVSKIVNAMGCFGCCFGFRRNHSKSATKHASYDHYKAGASQERLLKFPRDDTATGRKSTARGYIDKECCASATGRELLGIRLGSNLAEGNGWYIENAGKGNGGSFSVKITCHADNSQDRDGNKMINQYVRQRKLGNGSYGKVVLHRSLLDNNLYAIKIFHKSRLRKIRVAPSETAMMDVLREVDIMKRLNHPNIVRLVEVIDDPESDQLYLVLEYMEGQRMFEGAGPPGGLGEATARRYFRDLVTGLIYLHSCKVIHGDIKPENLMISRDGRIKIGDFGVSRTFEDENDLLRRSPGTPVFTAPECCKGLIYHGKAADVWALGVTLYCMVLGQYPFVGESLQDTYDKIVQQELFLPPDLDPDLRQLLEGLLCKDPDRRVTLDAVSRHPWVLRGYEAVDISSQ